MLAVETHPQRQEIIDCLLAGESGKKIAERLNPKLSHVSIYKFRNQVIKPRLQAARNAAKQLSQNPEAIAAVTSAVNTRVLTEALEAAKPLISRIAQHRATVDARIENASDKVVAGLISADLKGLELEARLTGLLDGGAHVSVNNVAVLLSPKCEDAEQIAIEVHAEPVIGSSANGE